MKSKKVKIFIGILVIALTFIAYQLVKIKWDNNRLVKISDTLFSGPPAQRVPIKYIAPINPKADIGTQNLLKYFYALASNTEKNFFLSGQDIAGASNISEPITDSYQKYFAAIESVTGKLPVIMGASYDSPFGPERFTEANKILINHWNKGGLMEISISPNNPFTGGNSRDHGLAGHKYDDLFTPGNVVNNRLLADLDKFAAGLEQLQNAGVTVIFRQFQEMNGDWFWWSYGENGRVSHEEFGKLWNYVFDYFTNKKGLHNLVLVYAPNATLSNKIIRPVTYYYPGNFHVDMVGLDYYHDDMTQVNADDSYDAMVALGKPFGFAEIGPQSLTGFAKLGRKTFDNLDVTRAINTKYPQAVFLMYWRGWGGPGLFHISQAIAENKNARQFMNDLLNITLDKKVRETKFGTLK